MLKLHGVSNVFGNDKRMDINNISIKDKCQKIGWGGKIR